MAEKCLSAEVFRWSLGDCTNSGVSKNVDTFVLANTDGPFESSDDKPALYLAKWYGRTIACPEDLQKLYPASVGAREDSNISHLGGYQFGGNFIYSSDSRFPSDAPIPIYDRQE